MAEMAENKMATKHVEAIADYSEDTAHRGQLLFDEERQLGVLATAKLHRRALLTCSVTFTAGLVFGFDTVVNGASISMPSFLLYFGSMGPTGPFLPSIWTSLWTAMSGLCQAIGAIIIGLVADRFGRKRPACGAAALTLIGTAVQYTAHARGTLMAGKMIAGLGVGAILAVATTYASEVAPLKLRGPIQATLVLFTVFMQGLALGVVRIFVPNVHEQAFRNVFATQWAVGGLALICFALVPESPVFLITRGDIPAARKAMGRIYGEKKQPDERTALLIRTIREEQANSKVTGGTYLECFKGTNRIRTGTVAFLYTTPNVGGAGFLAQNIYFLIIAGLEPIHAFDIGIGGFGLAILIILASGAYLKKISRRATVIAGCIMNFFFMVVIGALYYAPGRGALWAIAILMNLLISLQTSTLQAVGWPTAAEIPSYRLRAKTLSIGVFAQTLTTWFFSFVTPYMYNVDSGNLGARTGFVYAGTSVFLIIIAYLYCPNTAGLSTQEIDHLYEQKVSPRLFQARDRRLDEQGTCDQSLESDIKA